MAAPDLPPDVSRLRRRFFAMMILDALLTLLAIGFALAYYRLHQAWGLPAVFAAVAAGLVAQVWFVWMFRNTSP